MKPHKYETFLTDTRTHIENFIIILKEKGKR
jgi:hypothetical protein